MSSSLNKLRLHPLSWIITLAWLGMMTILVRDHLLPPPPPSDARPIEREELAEIWTGLNDHMAIRRGEETVGMGVTVAEPNSDRTGHLAWQRMEWDLTVMGTQQRLTLNMVADLDLDMSLERFWVGLDAAGMAVAEAEGEVREGDLLCRVNLLNGSTQLYRQPLDGPISLGDALRNSLLRDMDLVPGNAVRVPSLGLMGGAQFGEMIIEIGDLTLVETMHGAITGYEVTIFQAGRRTEAWVNEMGDLIKMEIFGDLTMERIPRDMIAEERPHLLGPVEMPEFEFAENIEANPFPTARGISLLNALGDTGL